MSEHAYGGMNMKFLLFFLLSCSAYSFAETIQPRHFESGLYQAHLLELYTSEGCSSCPPAEAWLASISPSELNQLSVIPLAFHVTYWDYIGWKDKFAQKQFDRRQRKMVLEEGGRTVYTPQFFIDSQTQRGIASILNKRLIKNQKITSVLKIKASLNEKSQTLKLDISLKQLSPDIDDVVRLSVVSYENAIQSAIKAGENAGRVSLHQYVVRELQTALVSLKELKTREFIFNKAAKNWSGMVVFVESGNKVIEALNIPL